MGGKLYTYQGGRTATALAEFAKGGYLLQSSEPLPKDRGMFFYVKKGIWDYADTMTQVFRYVPSLLPLTFAVGFILGLGFGVMIAGSPSKPKPKPKRSSPAQNQGSEAKKNE